MDMESGDARGRADDREDAVAGDVTRFEVERVLDAPSRWLNFPPTLEAQFERDTGAARSRVLAAQTLVALALFNILIALDYVVVPDVIALAVMLRTVVVTGVGVAIVVALRRYPPKRVRESLVALLTVVAAVAIAVMIAASEGPHRGDYNYGLIVVVMFAVMTQRLRFGYAVLASAGCLGVQLVSLQVSGAFAWESKVTAVALMLSTILLALMAGYDLERQERLRYLTGLRERLRTDRFEALSYLDALTGLGNRRALEVFLGSFAKSGEYDGLLSLMMVDIDHFKSFNDHHGHLSGDDCLRRVGGMLVAEARSHGDRVYRFGGEEFVVAMPGVGALEAYAIAERVRIAVQRAGVPHEGLAPGATVTASFGVASGPATTPQRARGLLATADNALYEAKRQGRNRVGTGTDKRPGTAIERQAG